MRLLAAIALVVGACATVRGAPAHDLPACASSSGAVDPAHPCRLELTANLKPVAAARLHGASPECEAAASSENEAWQGYAAAFRQAQERAEMVGKLEADVSSRLRNRESVPTDLVAGYNTFLGDMRDAESRASALGKAASDARAHRVLACNPQ